MIKISDISIPLDYSENYIKKIIAKKLRINIKNIESIKINKKSVDARKKDDVHFVCSFNVKLKNLDETKLIKKFKYVTTTEPYIYNLPKHSKLNYRPVIVGFGPAGMFAALILAQAGQFPIVLERGKDVDSRTKDVDLFWESGVLNENSNVQFGEGGAGTFSDGKLNTGIKNKRINKVFSEFVKAGAPEEILYLSKPHIGTDKLKEVVKNIRKNIINLGGEIRFNSRLNGIKLKNNQVCTVKVNSDYSNEYEIETDNVILAIGHSARDTFEYLNNLGVKMEAKAFSVGVRIEHSRKLIDKSRYGKFYNHPSLSAADYKLSTHLKSGRGVYTFCMCPGGTVVGAASEKGCLVTNGMSEFARDKQNSNSAVLVGITPKDFNGESVLAGVEYQRRIERKAFELGGGDYTAPIQLLGDFLKQISSSNLGDVLPSYKPGFKLTDISSCFPSYVSESIRYAIAEMDKQLNGFSCYDAIITAAETRSSSPLRILRDEKFESVNIKGLYPCGEGAGYAGGIVSAAVDGIKCAESILKKTFKESGE